MNKFLHFDAPRGHYHSDAAVVWCFDNRFRLALTKFLKRRGLTTPDVITVAGGAKALASPGGDAEREFLLDQIQKSIRLHQTKLVVLMVHSDCGAYGGLHAFGGNRTAESEHHKNELARAADVVRNSGINIPIEGYFADFEGIWTVSLAG